MTNAISCPACQAATTDFDSRFGYDGRTYTLRICKECRSRFYDPIVIPDYTSHTDSEVSIRDYVEQNANVDFLTGRMLQIIGAKAHGRLLDIGCGYGFSTDAARRLAGWDVIGVEPSAYGRRGAAALGVPMLHEFIDEKHPLAAERFDLIFSSEVIEHMEDPVATLRFWASMLADDGVIALTTPDSSYLDRDDIGYPERLAKLSPGSHVVLFSKTGLERAFALAGLRFTWVRQQQGSLIATASNRAVHPIADQPTTDAVGERYMRATLDADISDPMLKAGLRCRLMENLVRQGRYQEAEQQSAMLPEIMLPTAAIDTYEELLDRLPAFAPALLYCRGIIALNHRSQFAHARQLFNASAEACIMKLRVSPSSAVVEADLLGQNVFHAALAAEYAGDVAWARSQYAALINLGTAYGCRQNPTLEARARLALGALGEGNNITRGVFDLTRRVASTLARRMRSARG